MNIKKKRERIETKLSFWRQSLYDLQAECAHPEETLNRVPDSSTGGWDKDSDAYWDSCHCLLCNKKWTHWK